MPKNRSSRRLPSSGPDVLDESNLSKCRFVCTMEKLTCPIVPTSTIELPSIVPAVSSGRHRCMISGLGRSRQQRDPPDRAVAAGTSGLPHGHYLGGRSTFSCFSAPSSVGIDSFGFVGQSAMA